MADEMPTDDEIDPEMKSEPQPGEASPESSAGGENSPGAMEGPHEAAAGESVAVGTAVAEPPKAPDKKQWYVVKVQSGREESIKEAIERRVKIEGLEEYFGQIVIPMEKVTELRKGKRYIKERKLYPGYLMVQVEFNENILYLFRETSGVGDFVGGSLTKPPQPMKAHEVEKMLALGGEGPKQDEKIKLRFDRGDRVKIRDGAFTGMEGEVKDLLEAKAHVRVEVTIFGRPVSVELEYWQVEPV
jgi:transcription termination/antitermination protein NusG